VLTVGKFEKLSIADPKAAPYGQAAVETLTKLKLYDALKPKIVTGGRRSPRPSSTCRPARPSWASWPCRR
jgi:ABC-type molybdate transport system substrate-binding protein